MLLQLYNEIFNCGEFPNDWKQYRIFFIPKQDNQKVRPISLASCLLKIFEKMINMRLTWWLEHHNKMPKSQYGFRTGRSCTDNLAQVQTEILSAIENNERMIGLFIDIKSAYDNVISDVLISRLDSLGIPTKTQVFIYNLISERKVHIKYDDIDEFRMIYKGLPQGSVLSPILYTVYMMDLEKLADNCKVVQFADDVGFFTRSDTPRIALQHIESTVNNVNTFLKNSGLEIAPEKCQLCIFNDLKNGSWSIKIDKKKIKSQKSVKFLGITFEASCKWNIQVETIKKKCIGPLSILNYLRSTWKGADPCLLLRLYKALVRSRIEYGAFLFTLTTTQQKTLDKIQFRALRLAMGYRQSTPTNVILAEAREPPLKLRFKYLCKNYICRVISNIDHPVTTTLQNLVEIIDNPVRINKTKDVIIVDCFKDIEKIAHYINKEDKPVNYVVDYQIIFYQPEVSFEEGLRLQQSKRPDKDFNLLFKNKLNQSVGYFTDGSKIKGKPFVGFAFLCSDGNIIKKGRTVAYSSIFTAEAMAIFLL